MRASLSRLAVAFALANLYLLSLSGPLVSPQHQLIFHLPGSATALFLPVILDLLALTGLLFLLLSAVEPHPRIRLLLWAALLLPLPVALLETIASFNGHPANLRLLTSLLFLTAAAPAFTSARLSALVPTFRRAEPALTTLLSFVSLSGLVLLGQLLWNGWQTRHLNPAFHPSFVSQALAHAAPNQPGKPKPPFVLWVILDELSYAQIFPNRQPGILLPNLDQLAAQSSVLMQVTAAAEFTRIAVPSMLTGLPLTATNPTADGQHLLLHPRGARHWTTLDPADTVFADAARDGLPTAVAGWYEPYCRLLPAVLDRCFWTYRDQLPGNLSADASLGANMLAPLRDLAEGGSALLDAGTKTGPTDLEGQGDVQRHAADYRELYAAADRMLRDQNTGLLLLHMPIPHPWGFYDRRTGAFPAHRTSYLDNLVLADLYLGHLRAEMEADGTWDNATVIVMGDHGWRAASVWRPSGFWTREEEQASRKGALRDRPAMLVKLAHEQSPSRIDTPFAAFRTRALLDAILSGGIKTPETLTHWVAAQPASPVLP